MQPKKLTTFNMQPYDLNMDIVLEKEAIPSEILNECYHIKGTLKQ